MDPRPRPRRPRLELAVAVLLPLAGGALLAATAPRVGSTFAGPVAAGVLLLIVVVGRWLAGGRVGWGGKLFLLAGAATLVGVVWLAQPRPLTMLSRQQLAAAFEHDAVLLEQTDRGLEALLKRIEQADIPPAGERPLSPDQEVMLRQSWRVLLDHALLLDNLRHFYEEYYRFDIGRQRAAHVTSFLQAYAADISLYEKAARFVARVSRNSNAKTFLDAPHPGLPGGGFSRFREHVLGTIRQGRLLLSEAYLDYAKLLGAEGRLATRASWLRGHIDARRRSVEKLGLLNRAEQTVRADFQLLKRGVSRMWYPVQKEVAELLGDTKVRRAGSYLIDKAQREKVDAMLEPGDILISRKNWYLSNVGLPGFWPHAIVYLGNHEKLARAFDSDPAVQKWLLGQRAGGETLPFSRWLARRYPKAWASYTATGKNGEPKRVIEAVSEGVVFSSLYACAGDYLAGLRPRLDKLAKAQAIDRALAHWGKPYDFDFDFATDHALVCTELVWRAYQARPGQAGLSIPLVPVLGRQTLPANELAAFYARHHGKPSAQLELVFFVDARERQRSTFLSTEASFRASHRRSKWDIAQK